MFRELVYMKKALLLVVCGLLLLTSCANSTNESSGVDENNMVGITDIDVTANEERIKSTDYDNFRIDDSFKVSVPKTDSLGIYQVIYTDDFDKKGELLFKKYISDYDKKNAQDIDDNSSTKIIQYDDGKTFSMVTSTGGFVLADKQYLNKVRYGDSIPFIQTDLVDTAGNTEYTIGNKSVILNELVSSCDSFISEFVSSANYPNTIKPFSFSTQTIDDGSIAGIMHCRYNYKDLPVFDIQSIYDEYTNKIAMLTPPTITFTDGDKITQFAAICGLCDYKTIQTVDKIVSPADAVALTSKKLSGYLDYELQYEELVYFPTCNENRNGIEPQNGNDAGDVITLTPYWILYFEPNWWHETFAAVNAVTGEVDFVRNVR